MSCHPHRKNRLCVLIEKFARRQKSTLRPIEKFAQGKSRLCLPIEKFARPASTRGAKGRHAGNTRDRSVQRFAEFRQPKERRHELIPHRGWG
jgi:hypothetical protein